MERIKRLAKKSPSATVSFSLAAASVFLRFTVLLFLFAIPGVFFLRELAWWNIVPILLTAGVVLFLDLRLTGVRKQRKGKPGKDKKRLYLRSAISLLIIFALIIGIVWSADKISSNKFEDAVKGREYNVATWHLRALSEEWADFITFWNNDPGLSNEEESLLVMEYFELMERQRTLEVKELRGNATKKELNELAEVRQATGELQRSAQKILQSQVRKILVSENIVNPYNKTSAFFPPALFRIEPPPRKLVVASRDKLEIDYTSYLASDISPEKIKKIESKVESKGYSVLIVKIGGLSTYPSIVAPRSPHRAISTIAHEWVHSYVIFRPLGNITAQTTHERRVIEETIASMVGDEVRDILWEEYYAPYIKETNTAPNTSTRNSGSINFYEEMRETRERVEEMLENGEIEKAEKYMRDRRDWLEENGYYIRKLNQAYFAFYGAYATNPAYKDAHGGVGTKLAELRENSSSLKEFLELSTSIRTLDELDDLLNK